MIKNWIVSSSAASSPKPAEESHKASSQEVTNPQVSSLGLDVSLAMSFPELRAYKATSLARRLLFQSWMPFPPLTSPLSISRLQPPFLSFHLTPSHHSQSPASIQRSVSHPVRLPNLSPKFHRLSCINRLPWLLPTRHKRTWRLSVLLCSAQS